MNDQSAVDIEQFLEYLETSETADDVLPEEIEAAEKAYQEYLEGRDPGKSLSLRSVLAVIFINNTESDIPRHNPSRKTIVRLRGSKTGKLPETPFPVNPSIQ